MLAITVIAMIDRVSEFSGATTRDRIDHASMSQGNSIAKLLQVSRCVLPDRRGDRRHGLRQRPPKDLFDRLAGIGRGDIRQMQIDHGRLQAAVSHVLLNDAQREPCFE